jgi:hypothetical protein
MSQKTIVNDTSHSNRTGWVEALNKPVSEISARRIGAKPVSKGGKALTWKH